ncbi:MAG: FAD:protein FMN transferase [Lachnospiraceae bacterium]|nr:FAD:protein FMN transferase [Lachnospiraceae bacterium]
MNHCVSQTTVGRPVRRFGLRPFPYLLSLAVGLSALSFSCPVMAEENKTSETCFFLDTVITITLYGDINSTAMDGCFDLLDEYEQMLSRTIEGSDIWNINHSAGEPTEVSEETASLIETALYYSEVSDGAFDITITPLIELWDIDGKSGTIYETDTESAAADTQTDSETGSETDTNTDSESDPDSDSAASPIPSDAEIAEALSHVDYTAVSLDGTSVTLSDAAAEIDLGGIAKGYIADRLEEYLLSQGIESALINLGGNVQTIGTKPDGSSWKIGIQKPFGQTSDLITVVECTGESVVTSGTYERYFEVDGTIYHHILDPKTGYPADNGLTSVTILADSSTECDALSTTCFLLGLEDGMALIESLDGIEALFITEDETMLRSSGFPEE